MGSAPRPSLRSHRWHSFWPQWPKAALVACASRMLGSGSDKEVVRLREHRQRTRESRGRQGVDIAVGEEESPRVLVTAAPWKIERPRPPRVAPQEMWVVELPRFAPLEMWVVELPDKTLAVLTILSSKEFQYYVLATQNC